MAMKGFYKNIRVADFSWMGVGSIISKYLGENGAELIKIESQVRPDMMRTLPPFKDDKPNIDGSQLWADLNVNKYSIALDLTKPAGVEIAKRIVSVSDVVCESWTPGTMEKLGLSYEDLKKVKPDIIMVSAGLQGRGGPNSLTRGSGFQLTAMTGLSKIMGWPDRTPTGSGTPYTDFVAPLFGSLALHAALDFKERTGKGQYFDMSQMESCIQFFSPMILDYVVNQRVAERQGNFSSYVAPHGIYQCAGNDRWCAIAVCNDEQWNCFCNVVNEKWTQNAEFATFAERVSHHTELDRQVETWTKRFSPEELTRILQEAGVPAGILAVGSDLWNDPQLRYYPGFCVLEHPVMGTHVGLRRGVELSKMQYEMRRCPLLGEHTEYVCKNIIGMSDEEFIKHMSEKVFE